MTPLVDWSSLDKVLARFEARSLLSALAAAADSPGGGHRLPSLEILWIRTLQQSPKGAKAAEPQVMQLLVDAAHRSYPPLRLMEDWWPPDPRLDVRFPIGSTRLAFHPGLRSNPVAVLRTAVDVANAIDRTVVRRLGFGLTDLIEVALRYSDWRIGRLRGAWPKRPLPRDVAPPKREDLRRRIKRIDSTPIIITKREIRASSKLLRPAPTWISECSHPVRAARAWEYLQKPASAIQFHPGKEPSAFGSVAVAATVLGDIPFPAAYVLDAVLDAVVGIAGLASSSSAALGRLRNATYARALRRFGQSPPAAERSSRLRRGTKKGPEGVVDGFMRIEGRRAFVFGAVVALREQDLGKDLSVREKALLGVTPSMVRKVHPGFGSDGEIFRILIVGGPYHPTWAPNQPIVRIHIEELTDITLDADQGSSAEDPDVVSFSQFVMELSRGPSASVIPLTTVEDAWQLWIRTGTLDVTGTGEIGLFVDPVLSPSRWDWSAAWEPFDSRLAAGSLPPHWEWIHAELEPNAAAAELWMLSLSASVSGSLPLIVVSQINPELAMLSIDPAFPVVGVADGVSLTFRNYPRLYNLLSVRDGLVVIIYIEMSVKPAPAPAEGLVGVGISAVGNSLSVSLGADWIELLIEDAGSAHALLGRAIADGLREIGALAPKRHDRFVSVWERTPPVAMLHMRPGTLPVPGRGQLDLPIGKATAAAANKYLGRFVAKTGLRPGMYTGRAAIKMFDDKIAPALQDALHSLVRQWSSTAILEVASMLNAVHAERFRWETELELALSAPWAATWRAKAETSRDPAEISRPLEHLVEILLRESPDGAISPDRHDFAEATHIVSRALDLMLLAAAARSGMHGLRLMIGPAGLLHLEARKARSTSKMNPRTVDFDAYRSAFQHERLKDRRRDTFPPRAADIATDVGATDTEFIPIEAAVLPKSFMDADLALKHAVGSGLNGITALLGSAISWSGYKDSLALTSPKDLIASAHSWSRVPIIELDAAFEMLVVDPERLQSVPFQFWEQERRRYRLATKPLVRLGNGQILIIPRMIQHTQAIFAAYLLDGRLPWSATEVPAPVRDAYVRYRQTMNRQLQREAVSIVRNLGLRYKERVEPSDVLSLGLALPGEVDLLAADIERRKLWVCEVKDQSPGSSPSTIAIRLEKYLGPQGYIDRLLSKRDVITSSLRPSLIFLGVESDFDAPWRVLALMITRRLEPAAFAHGKPVMFTTIDGLEPVMAG